MPTPGPQAAHLLRTHPKLKPLQCLVLWAFSASDFWSFTVGFCLSGETQRSCFFLFSIKTELPEMITRGWNLNFRSTTSKCLVYVPNIAWDIH